MGTVWQDFRYALRMLAKNPGFTAVAVLTLALGISVNATMFTMVSAYMMRRPPGTDPEHVLVISAVSPTAGFQFDANPLSAPNYLAWRDANYVFAQVAAADEYRPVSLTVQNHPEALLSAAVSPNYFAVLGVAPQFGRTFSDSEDQPGRDRVLSHDLWVRRFASDPNVVGRTVRLNREDYVVAGVMPADFKLMGYPRQLWTPLVLSAADQAPDARKNRSLRILGRLKPGTTLEQARAEFTAFASRAQNDFPDSEKGWGVSVRTLPDFLVYTFGIRSALAIVMTAVGFILLIACGNVSGLLLTRATGRQKELAVRISLGATRSRIMRQLLTEGLLIALIGGAAGLLAAVWGVNVVRANMTFNDAVSAVPLGLDRNVLLFTVFVSLLSAALCGVVPAFKASRTDVNTNLKEESRAATSGPAHHRLRSILITGEIALALFLLIGAGLLIHGIFMIDHQELGFRADHLLTASVTLDSSRYKDAAQQALFVRDVIPHIQNIPGVENVAVASDLPATGPGTITFHIKDQPQAPADQPVSALDLVATHDYFRTAGISLLQGRTFTATDDAAAPQVILVSQEFVHRCLHDQPPLGKHVSLDIGGQPAAWREIVGVVTDVKFYSGAPLVEPQVYEPFLQRPSASFALMIRTTGDPNSLATALRKAVGQLDEELPLDRVMSMSAVIEQQGRGNALFTQMLGFFALLALILAAIGIYALIAYSVAHRTHEIGIRMALGAERSDVLRIILWQGLRMIGIGTTIGILLALPLPRIFTAMFFVDLHLGEPRLYFLVPAVIVAIAMLATYIPARRATRVDPMVALRYE